MGVRTVLRRVDGPIGCGGYVGTRVRSKTGVPGFNVFDYLRKNSEQERVPELQLSRIIAHLLDPRQTHGQETLFLRAFLDAAGLNGDRGWPDIGGNGIDVEVETEHSTRANRSIDIFVEIVADKQRYCLAIENKPYADDLENQVQDYLKYLSEKAPRTVSTDLPLPQRRRPFRRERFQKETRRMDRPLRHHAVFLGPIAAGRPF